MGSPISGSISFSDPYDESELGVLAPALLTYVSPPSLEWRKDYQLSSSVVLRVPSSSERGTHPARTGGEANVLRARALPLAQRQVAYLLSPAVLGRIRLWDGMVKEHPMEILTGKMRLFRRGRVLLPQSLRGTTL
ncbi:unnamed protein product [Eruca vesicaria subsp. sativa]|uniref:Uncharacterized protein n=1 Tax=Eruca vesicaria subsp. sativa TaxID=29727 RepID=A0ABC8LS69_ERUVS|nr:unnamed protein product [Eruca vesicaria subsp. sativa]